MATPNNILGRAKLPKISGRCYTGRKGLDGGPPRATGPSNGKPGHSSEITVPMAPRAGESSLAPSLEKRGASLPSEDIEIDRAELKDGTLVELVEDSKNPSRTCFAVGKTVNPIRRSTRARWSSFRAFISKERGSCAPPASHGRNALG